MDGEPPNAQDERVKRLWKKLDTRDQGHLDLEGLKEGLRKIDHPLQNADALLKDVLKVVDKNKDGQIQYSEFCTFVEQTEKELWQLFKSIDRDQNGLLDKSELRAAFLQAGLFIPDSKLDQFFSEVDTNNDGELSFDEWRDFLLFIPADGAGLKDVLSYYTATVQFNSEGDVHISDGTKQGLGTYTFPNFYKALFGVLFIIATPMRSRHKQSTIPSQEFVPLQVSQESQPHSFPWDPGEVTSNPIKILQQTATVEKSNQLRRESPLTDLLIDPGYFVAGGIAGVVSRTATAPLDRLKVYLIAQTGTKEESIQAVKSAAPIKATKIATRPLVEAIKVLWRMGGMKSMFAGNGLNVVKVMPESAIKFGSYEGSRRAMARLEGHEDPKALHGLSQFFAAGMGGIISHRMQCETVQGGPHGNVLILSTARKMWSTTGIRSFYRGLPMGLVGMFPYSAIDLTTFEKLKNFITARNARMQECEIEDPAAAPGNFTIATIGAFSGAFGATAVYPLNLLRTRLQSQGTAIHPPTYTGIWDVTIKTIKGEGYKGLFKGITPNLLKVVPSVSITYVVYDNSKRLLGLQ